LNTHWKRRKNMTYNINFTDPSKDPIQVPETGINESLSVKFPGRIRLEWGKDVNENLLRMLENFACPSLDSNESVPDLSIHEGILSNPVDGQLWYNTTNERIYKYSVESSKWLPLANRNQMYAANWGQIQHGEQLPRPVATNGYVFPYEECIWSVSPHNYLDGFTSVRCFSFPNDSTVVMQYQSRDQQIVVDGVANYLIIGITGNDNLGEFVPPPPLGQQTPPEPTPGVSSPAEFILYDYSSNQATLPLTATAQIRTEELSVLGGGGITYQVSDSSVQNFEASVSDATYVATVRASIDKNSFRIIHKAGKGVSGSELDPPIEQRTHTFLTWTDLPLDSYSTLHIRGISFASGAGTSISDTHAISVAIGKDLVTVDQTSGSAGLILPEKATVGIYENKKLQPFVFTDYVFTIPPALDRVNNNITITYSYTHLQDFEMLHDGDIYLSN